ADSLADIVECDLVAEIGCAYFRRDNVSDVSALEFFVELHRAYDFIPWKILRQTRRQIESSQNVDHRIAVSGREAGSFNWNSACSDDSQAEGFAAKKFPVISRAFQRATDGVADIQKGAFGCLVAIGFRDGTRLDL